MQLTSATGARARSSLSGFQQNIKRNYDLENKSETEEMFLISHNQQQQARSVMTNY